MKFFLALLLLIVIAVNAETVTNAVRSTAVETNANVKCSKKCVNNPQKVRVLVQNVCKEVKVSKCHKRTKCCKTTKRCIKSFCKTLKKKCSWNGVKYKVGHCAPKRRVCKRINKKTHRVVVRRRTRRVIRKNNRRQRRFGRKHRRHHKRHHKKAHKIVIRKLKKLTRKQRKIRRLIKKRSLKRKLVKKQLKKKRVVFRRNQVTCQLYADPHVTGFNKRHYDVQQLGDWVLYRGKNLSAHYRGKRFGRWVGPIKFGIRLFHHRIFTVDFKFNQLKIDGKVVNLVNGVIKLGRATITRKNNKLTFSTNEGEDIDILSYGWFFNAYVRSRATNLKGICSQQFLRSNFFNHPQAVHDKKIKLPKCARKVFYTKKCKKMGHLKRGALKACVFDLCAGLSKKIEKRLLKRNKKEKKKKVHIKRKLLKHLRVRRITCELYADPHVKGFNKKYFEAQTVGDWVLYRGKNLSAHYRGKRFGRWVGPIKFGVRLFKYRISSVGFKFDTLRINGKIRKIMNGVTKLKKGGLIRRNGNRITFSSNHGEEVDFVSYGSFFNAYVRSNYPKITGICSQKFVHSHFFRHYHIAKKIKIIKKRCLKKRKHTLTCQKRGLKGTKLKFCVRDLCNGLSKKIEKRILRRNKKETKKKVKLVKVEKRVHRITCQLYADPHVQGFNTRHFEAQTVGDWVLYRGRNLSAHYRGKSFGRWVGPIKFGVRLYHNRIYSVGFSFNQLKINGQVRNIPVGTTKLGKKGLIERRGNKITFSTGDGEAVDFVTFNSFFNAYVRSNIPRISGICSQQFIRSSFFNHPVRGKKIAVTKRPCPRRKAYIVSCKRRGLRGTKLKFCVRDLCAKLPKSVEKRILRRNKKEDKKDPPRKRVKRGQCQMYADPHVHGFNGRNYEAQVDGDWIEYKGLHLSVHYRGKRFGSWVGQIQWGAYVFGQRISSRGFTVNQVNIDGQNVSLRNGKNKLPKGGFLTVSGNKITISTGDGEEADFQSFGSFFNSFVRSDVENISGICSQQFIKSKFFSSPVAGKIVHLHQKLCKRRVHFEGRCRRNGLVGRRLINCVFDFCQGLSKRLEKKMIRNIRKEKRKHLVVKHKKWFKRVMKQIGRRHLFVRKIHPLVRRHHHVVRRHHHHHNVVRRNHVAHHHFVRRNPVAHHHHVQHQRSQRRQNHRR